MAVFKATLDSPSVASKDKEQVTKAGDYLTEQLATMAMLVGKSMATLAALYNAYHMEKKVDGEAREDTLI